jgi:hypothetical protein
LLHSSYCLYGNPEDLINVGEVDDLLSAEAPLLKMLEWSTQIGKNA